MSLVRARFTYRLLSAGAIVAIALIWGTLFPSDSNAGNTYQGGNCWQWAEPSWSINPPPIQCRTNWAYDQVLCVRLVDQITSQARPYLYAPAEAARSAWTSASGPQILHWEDLPNATWIYLTDAPGDALILIGAAAITTNCDYSSCTYSEGARNVLWSDIYLSRDILRMESPEYRQGVFAHEIGHALGLWHHNEAGYLMIANPEQFPLPTGPQQGDIGAYPPCSQGPNLGGIRCVYRWEH